MILIAELIGLLVWTYASWYVGRNWVKLNSVSDIQAAYTAAVAKAESAKANVEAEIKSAEDKAAALKALV